MPGKLNNALRRSIRNRAVMKKITARMFTLTGSDVRTRWYAHYKAEQLGRVFDSPFDERLLPHGFGLHLDERIVEYPWFLSRLPEGPGRLLDAGSVLNFEYILDQPKVREKQLTIMTLAPEPECFWHRSVSYVYGDLRDACFRDNYFDWIVCLSTLEHVGLDNTLYYTSDGRFREEDSLGFLPAVSELQRVLKPGGSCFITLPFGVAKMRGWLQIFDQKMVDRMVETFAPSQHEITYFKYSAQHGWGLASQESAADSMYFDCHSDIPWKDCPAAAEAVVCLRLTKQ